MPKATDVNCENMKCANGCEKQVKKDRLSPAMLATRVNKDNYMLCGTVRSASDNASSGGGGDANGDKCDLVSPIECSGCFHSPCARCSPLHPCQRSAAGEASATRTFAEQVVSTDLLMAAVALA